MIAINRKDGELSDLINRDSFLIPYTLFWEKYS